MHLEVPAQHLARPQTLHRAECPMVHGYPRMQLALLNDVIPRTHAQQRFQQLLHPLQFHGAHFMDGWVGTDFTTSCQFDMHHFTHNTV